MSKHNRANKLRGDQGFARQPEHEDSWESAGAAWQPKAPPVADPVRATRLAACTGRCQALGFGAAAAAHLAHRLAPARCNWQSPPRMRRVRPLHPLLAL